MLANNNELGIASRHIEIQLDGAHYRMDREDYNDRHSTISLGIFYLVTLMLIANAYNVTFLFPNKTSFVLIYLVAVMTPIGVPIFRGRKNWPLLMVSYILLILNMATDILLPANKVFIAGGVYGGVMLLASLVMLQERKLIVCIVIAVLEGVLMQVKASGVIVEDWGVILLPLTATEVCLFITLIILIILAGMEVCCQEAGRSPLWGYRLTVKTALISTHFFQLGLPIAIVYSQGMLIPMCALGIIVAHHLLFILFIVFRREKIICSFATPIRQVPVIQQADAPSAFEKTIQRVSSHWFTIEDKTTSNQNPERSKQPISEEGKKEECLICLTNQAVMIWSPCGHLSTCETCADYLVSQGRLSCLLCKRDAKGLLKVDMGRPLAQREYSILKEVTIMKTNVLR